MQLLMPQDRGLVVARCLCLCCSPRWRVRTHAEDHGHHGSFCHRCTVHALKERGLAVLDCGGRDPWLVVAWSQDVLDELTRFLSARRTSDLWTRVCEDDEYARFNSAVLWRGQLILKASVHGCGKVRLNQAVVLPQYVVERMLDSDGSDWELKVIEREGTEVNNSNFCAIKP